MATAKMRGGLYRNAGGHGFHDAQGDGIPLQEVPRELLSEDELAELEDGETTEEGEADAESAAAPRQPAVTPGLPKEFPGREQLIAAGLTTLAAVFAHPNIATVKGIGPKTAKSIAALRPQEV